MEPNHQASIRVISIINIVLSALALCGCIIGIVGLALFVPVLTNSGVTVFQNGSTYQGNLNDIMLDFDMSPEGMVNLLVSYTIIGIVGCAVEAAFAVVTIIAAIVGVKNAATPEKLGSVFGWNLAGLICAFLGGRIISGILFIIVTVYASRDRRLAAAGVYYGYPNQGYYVNPQQYYYQPQQPYQQYGEPQGNSQQGYYYPPQQGQQPVHPQHQNPESEQHQNPGNGQ